MEGRFSSEERRRNDGSIQMLPGKMLPSFSKILHIFPLERRRVPLFDKKNTQGRKTTNLCKYFLDEYGILKKHFTEMHRPFDR